MASGFSDLSLGNSDKAKVKLPKGFGSSDVVSTVVELVTNNKLGDSSIYLEMFNKRFCGGRDQENGQKLS